VLSWVRVSGRSMLPSLRDGDCVLVLWFPGRARLLAWLARRILVRRGTVVMVRPAAHLRRLEVKCVASVAGDWQTWGANHSLTRRIPPGYVFVVGTNGLATQVAADSHGYGPLPSSEVVGWVLAVRKC